MKSSSFSRRKFMKSAGLTAGLSAAVTATWPVHATEKQAPREKLPREIWVAGISQENLNTQTVNQMVDEVFQITEDVLIYKPDVICLPELFPTANNNEKLSREEKVNIGKRVVERFSAFAKQHSCYVICPVIVAENGRTYNSACVIDRKGKVIGKYHKMHPTENEINNGLTAGPLVPPVFETDFGKIGIQICFDMQYDDGWTSLGKQGAEIVFWPSAYAGGKTVGTRAVQQQYVVASSTRKGPSRLSDITGTTIAETGFWDKNFYCAPVNLEKAFLHSWPYIRRFDDIKKKYGRDVRITIFHEEEWSIIESLSPDILIDDIMKEFDLKTFRQHMYEAERSQIRSRKP